MKRELNVTYEYETFYYISYTNIKIQTILFIDLNLKLSFPIFIFNKIHLIIIKFRNNFSKSFKKKFFKFILLEQYYIKKK